MKYDALKKPSRDALLLKYRQEHPNHSLKEIGKFFGITKQRVSQILKNLQEPVK